MGLSCYKWYQSGTKDQKMTISISCEIGRVEDAYEKNYLLFLKICLIMIMSHDKYNKKNHEKECQKSIEEDI